MKGSFIYLICVLFLTVNVTAREGELLNPVVPAFDGMNREDAVAFFPVKNDIDYAIIQQKGS